MNITHRTISIALLLVAGIQLFGVSEKVFHGLWLWYVFYGYSNDGQTTLNISLVIFTYAASIIAIGIDFIIFKKSPDKIAAQFAKLSGVSLATGVLVLTILLFSPLGGLVQR